MGRKRLSKTPMKTNDPYRQKITKNTDLIGRLLDDMSQFNYNKDILIPLTEEIQKLQDNFDNKSIIISGTASSGKTSSILWLCKNQDTQQNHIITIDCRIYQSETQFIDYLTKQIGIHIKAQNFGKNVIINQNINFNGLNNFIENAGHKFTIIIKFAQKFIKPKQILLYNFFQWLNNNKIKQYIRVVICTRTLTFSQKLQKRIKSRMNIPFYHISLLRPQKILQIILTRIQYRKENTMSQNQVKLLQKLQNAFENNKQLDKILLNQYNFMPRGIVFYLKMMQLLLIQDLDMQKWQKITDSNLKTLVAQSFKRNSQFIVQYKEISKNLYKNLPFPQIILLGLIRRRFLRQIKGNFKVQSTLKSFYDDYSDLRSKQALQSQGSNFNYSCFIFQAALLNLAQNNFVTISISQSQGLNTFYKDIKSQYSPQDIKWFYQSLKDMPEFIKEIYSQL